MNPIIQSQMLSTNEVVDFVRAVGPYRFILIAGEKGIGKTSILKMLRKLPEYSNYIIPAPIDCTQVSDGSISIPDPDREAGVMRELPSERFGVSRFNQYGIEGARPVIIMMDEFGKAKQFVKNIMAPIISEYRIGGVRLPEGSIVVGSTNLSVEGLGDIMLPHEADRTIPVYMRKPTYEEWKKNFAVNAGINEYVMVTCEEMPQVFDSFLDYEEGGKHHGKNLESDNPYITNPHIEQGKCVTPRSLHFASDVLNNMSSLTSTTVQAALTGAVGPLFAQEIAARVRFGSEIPSFKEVMENPMHVPIPKNPAAQTVQVFQFLNRVQTGEHAEAALTYLERMRPEMQLMFAESIRDAQEALVRFSKSKKLGAMVMKHRKYL